MSIVTISSDLGENNYKLAALRASFIEKFPSFSINYLYQQEDKFDIESMAYQILGATHSFPEKSIHIIFCQYSITRYSLLLLKFKNHYIISSDNGIVSFFSNLDYDIEVYHLESRLEEYDFKGYVEQYIEALRLLNNHEYISKLQRTNSYLQTKPFSTGLVIQPDRIVARVLKIYESGNLVLNLTKMEFDSVIAQSSFFISFQTVKIRSISKNYNVTETNNRMGAIFNDIGFLEIFMIGGHVAKLFNINKFSNNKIEIVLDHDSNRQIKF